MTTIDTVKAAAALICPGTPEHLEAWRIADDVPYCGECYLTASTLGQAGMLTDQPRQWCGWLPRAACPACTPDQPRPSVEDARADVWDEGHRAACSYFPDCQANGHHDPNPYRAASRAVPSGQREALLRYAQGLIDGMAQRPEVVASDAAHAIRKLLGESRPLPVPSDHTADVPPDQRNADYQSGRWCGECRYGVVEDPPCCTPPATPSDHTATTEDAPIHCMTCGRGMWPGDALCCPLPKEAHDA